MRPRKKYFNKNLHIHSPEICSGSSKAMGKGVRSKCIIFFPTLALLIFIFQEPRNENVQPPVDDCLRRRRNEFSVVEQSSYKVLLQTLILYFTFYLKPGQTHLSEKVGWRRATFLSSSSADKGKMMGFYCLVSQSLVGKKEKCTFPQDSLNI